MPFRANHFRHLKTTELQSETHFGPTGKADGIAFQIEWLLTDFDTMRSVLTFLKTARTSDDPEDPVEILLMLLPEHASRINAFVTKEIKQKLLSDELRTQTNEGDDDDE